jgi:hypothetical protein
MPMFFVGLPIAMVSLVAMLINGLADAFRREKLSRWTPVIYIGLATLIVIPTAGQIFLLELMYSGWK